MPFEQHALSSREKPAARRSGAEKGGAQYREEILRQASATIQETEAALGKAEDLPEGPQLQTEALALELEGMALSQEAESLKIGRKSVAIEEDGVIDYRGPERNIQSQLEAAGKAFTEKEIQEEQFGIILEEVSRKSIKDAIGLAIASGFPHEKMLEILGRTAALMHPEDPEYQEDRIVQGLRYYAKFDSPHLEAFRAGERAKPLSLEAQEKTTVLGKRGEEVLAEINGAYAGYAKWTGKKGRKQAEAVPEFHIGQLMTRDEFEAYQQVKDIERVLSGVVQPKGMKQIIDGLPIPKEVLEELEQAEKNKGDESQLRESDITKTIAYAMSLIEALPLYKEKQKREAENAPYDHEFNVEWNRQAEPLEQAFKALISPYEGKESTVKEASALMELFRVKPEMIQSTIKQKRTKFEALSPLQYEATAKQLEKVKKTLEQKRDASQRGFRDEIQKRIDDISGMQETLRKGVPFVPAHGSGSSVGFAEIEGRFKGRQQKEERRINIPLGFDEGLEKANSAFPGFTYIAKNDSYTDQQYSVFMGYLVQDWTGQDGKMEQGWIGGGMEEGAKKEEEKEAEYQEIQKEIKEQFYQSRDEEENIDGDPSAELLEGTELMELSHPVDLMMIQGVFDAYDGENHVWKMQEGIPEPKRMRQTAPVICKIPAPVGLVRIPTPLYGKVGQDRIVGIGKDSEPIAVKTVQDEKGFIRVEVTKDSGIKELMYELQVPQDGYEIPSTSEKEYQSWLKVQKGSMAMQEAREVGKSLPPECIQFLKSIEGKSPRERVLEIEKFVRNIGFYDFKNKETFGLKRRVSLSRRLEVMRTRMEELRKQQPEALDKKILAGVCADFQELTTAMMEASGLVAGRLAGLRVSGEKATAANSHAASYVEFPPIDGERQIIPVDGTPATAFSFEEKQMLVRMRQATQRTSPQEEKQDTKEVEEEMGRSDDAEKEEERRVAEVVKRAAPLERDPQQGGEKQKTFGEEIDTVLTGGEKKQLQGLRDVLMYSPIKNMGSAWLRDPINQEQLKQLIRSVLQEKPDETSSVATGADLERMWKNLVVDWTVSRQATTREDLEKILAAASENLSEKQREMLLRLVEG